ncbi:MAG TPA: arginine deiminase-related protein [Saprospiraceae bacterium]|nr:arginine deiminase-related protein [Saprospiraceae bacterium]
MAQTTSHILMIRPHHFGFNEETAQNNSFQNKIEGDNANDIAATATAEFDRFVEVLRSKNINVMVVEDTDQPIKPDAVFPNNWVSFHEDGLVMTYPMFSPNRRVERRADIIEGLKSKFEITKDYTFEHYEEEGLFLEGTGSLILDRENKIAYANLSPRTDLRLLDKWCILTGYKKVYFFAKDRKGQDIYHTNVMMAIGHSFCVICLDCIPESTEKERLKQSLSDTEKEIITISLDQVEHFAGNMLEVQNNEGTHFLVMSSTAFASLTPDQKARIEKHTNILVGDIPLIENIGGGSVRCMMAEVFLPEKK